VNLIKAYDGDTSVNQIPVDPSTFGIREYGTENKDTVINDSRTDNEETSLSLLRAREQKLESIGLRDEYYNSPEYLEEIIKTLKELYDMDGDKNRLDESPTSIPLEDVDVNQFRMKPDYPDSPEPERIESRRKVFHSMTQTYYIQHVNIPERMYLIDNVFSKEYCDKMIDYLQFKDYELKFQKLFQDNEVTSGRIIMRTSLRRKIIDPEIAQMVWEAVKNLVPQQLEDGRKLSGIRSKMNFYKYSEGEFFNTHVDGGFRDRDTGDSSEYTFIVYLNDDFEGGSTRFCDVDFWETSPRGIRQVNAKQGSVLIFRQPNMKHCGAMIKKGIKYILQGMIMYGPLSYNRLGKPVGNRPYDFKAMVCDCNNE